MNERARTMRSALAGAEVIQRRLLEQGGAMISAMSDTSATIRLLRPTEFDPVVHSRPVA